PVRFGEFTTPVFVRLLGHVLSRLGRCVLVHCCLHALPPYRSGAASVPVPAGPMPVPCRSRFGAASLPRATSYRAAAALPYASGNHPAFRIAYRRISRL